MRAGVRAAACGLLAHPRHCVLFAAVAGLLLGPAPPGAAVLGAVAVAALAPVVAALARAGPRVAAFARAGPGVAALARAGSGAPGQVPPFGLALAAGLALLGGAAVADLRLEALESGLLPALTGQPVAVAATVLEPVRARSSGSAVARVRVAGGRLRGEVAVMRVSPDRHAGAWPGVGEIVEIAGRVAPLGHYDAYQRARGAGAAIDASSLRRSGRRRGGVAGALDAVRRRAERGLEHGLQRREADLLRGMVLGQDERLDQDVRTDFERSGLAHLLAVSGQNVMLLAILVLAASSVAGIPLHGRLLLALVLVAAYVPLAGGGPSIQRAGVMGAAGLVAALAGRPSSRWYAIGLAAAVTLGLNPRAASEPGWQLSFAAVLALLVLCTPLRAILERRLPGPVAEAAAITIAATIGTAPLLALHFGQVSLASLPANLLAAPAVAPIMWLGMLAAAAAQVSPALAAPFNALGGPLLAYLAALAHTAGAAPLAVLPVRIGTAGGMALACLVPGVLAAGLLALRRRLGPPGLGRARALRARRRAAVVLAGVAACAAIAFVALRSSPSFRAAPGQLVVSFLDVGQGDATLIQEGAGTSVLFDGGPPEARVYRELRRAGVRRLDLVVSTHKSRDHHGGLHAVLDRFPTRLLLENGDGTREPDYRRLLSEADALGIRRVAARAGQVLRVGRLVVRVLSPKPRPPGTQPLEEPNPRGVAAIVSSGNFDLWLSADAESDAILPLPLRRVEAMKVSHHGSSDPGLPHVLERLRPDVAAIEVGAGNTYGHPAPSTLAALNAAVPHVYRTDRDGTIELKVEGSRMTVRSSR